MATVSGNLDISITVMEEDLSCYICYNLLREPRDLDCQHVYCLQCLQDWVGKGLTIDCPECRYVTIVPPGGLTNLKTNLRLKNMAEKYAARVEKQKSVPICPNHEGERQHFFCVTCGVTVCHNCLVLDHERPQHEIKELKIIAKTQKTEMKAKLDRVQIEVSKVEDDEKKLDEIKRNVQAAKQHAESEIDKRVQEMKAVVEAKGKEIKRRLLSTCHQHLKTLQKEESRVKDRGKRLRNVHLSMQNVVETAADHVYMKQHASLVDKMEKLCATQREVPTSDMACLHFIPGSDPVDPAWFGKVVENDHRNRQLSLVDEFGTFKIAENIVSTQTGLLAVIDFEPKEVVIYHYDTSEYKRLFCLASSAKDTAKITNPLGVAVTSKCKFLLIDGGPVKVFSATGKYEKVLPNIHGDRITTTPDDMIVIPSVHMEAITVHQPNGELLKTHQVGTGLITVIASNGRQIAFTRCSDGKACVIDFQTGQELWSVKLKCPMGICFDEKSKSVLIAGNAENRGHCVIEQYCVTSGRLISLLCNPVTMTIHDGKLAVADSKSVKVYSIQ